MKKFMEYFNSLFGEHLPLRERYFNFAALGGIIASIFASIASFISKVGPIGLSVCFVCVLFFATIFIAFHLTHKLNACILACLIGLNLVLFPALYFTVGGIYSGMPIYFVMGLVFTVLMLDTKPMAILITIESLWYAGVFYLSYKHPEISNDIFEMGNAVYLDQAMDFFVVGISTAFLVKVLALCFEYQQKRTNELLLQLEELSVKDPLSGAYNRRFLLKYIESGMEKHRETRAPLSIIMFDIDKFKKVNDDFGHLIGDEVIKGFSNIMLNSCRNYDVVARYGGEEFILVMPGASEETAYARAEQIRHEVETAKFADGITRPITVSGGVASFNLSITSIEEFIGIADEHLYYAKENGRNRVIWTGSFE